MCSRLDHVVALKIGTDHVKRTLFYHRKCMVKGFLDCSSEFDFFEHCVYGKHNRVSFPTGATRAKRKLELVHSNVFGPGSIPSLSGSKYYVSFIDDFSRITWLSFMKKKLRVLEKFIKFKALVENQTDKMIKC